MPSTIVHLAFAGAIGAALLGPYFDRRTVGVLLVVTAIPDLDSFVALFWTAGHRAVLHNIWIPLLAAIGLWADLRRGGESLIRRRYGDWGVRVGWVCVFCYLFAGLAPDIVNGVLNPLWPVHDQFYHLDGKLELSTRRGIVQTFVETGSETASDGGGSGKVTVPAPESFGTTKEVSVTTAVNPAPTEGDRPPERIVPLFRAGWELMLFVVGVTVTAVRFQISNE